MSGQIYCRQYLPNNTPLGSNEPNQTTDPCAAEGVRLGKTLSCVTKETDCTESPITGAQSFCQEGQFCCNAKPPVTPPPVQQAPPPQAVSLPDPLSGVNAPQLIGNVIRTFTGVAGAIALLMFVYGGIMWILSGGDAAKVKDSKKILVNASIGLVLIFGAYFFTTAIMQGILMGPSQ